MNTFEDYVRREFEAQEELTLRQCFQWPDPPHDYMDLDVQKRFEQYLADRRTDIQQYKLALESKTSLLLQAEAALNDRDVKIAKLNEEIAAALALVADVRAALGDHGKRMQPELLEHCRTLVKNGARYVWLRDKSVPPHQFYLSVPAEFEGVRFKPHEVDAYIDQVVIALNGGSNEGSSHSG